MRISTNTMFAAGQARLSELQSTIVKTQQQLSTGRKILSPSDDPVGAARALDLTQSKSINTQFATNRQAATNSLSNEEGILQGTTSLLQDVKDSAIEAGGGALSDADRKFIAANLRGRLDELIGQANSTDGTGNYLFAGFAVSAPPFSSAASGAAYSGDQGQRLSQVGTSRQVAVTDPGDAVFVNVRNTGAQATTSDPANKGTGTASRLQVTDATQLTSHDYDVTFAGTGASATYTVTDKNSGSTVGAPSTKYVSGAPISFGGMQFSVSNAPQNGDVFKVRTPASQSVFSTISDLITALETPATGPAGQANLTHSLAVANGNIDNALDSILTVRASIGSRLKEMDSLDTAGQDRDVQFASALSQIQDLDFTKAISDFTQQNTTLQAAQKTFVQTSQLSLFSLL